MLGSPLQFIPTKQDDEHFVLSSLPLMANSLMVRSTVTNGCVDPIIGGRWLKFWLTWLLRGSRGQNDDPHVVAEVSMTNVTFSCNRCSSVCRRHAHRRTSSFSKEYSMQRNPFFHTTTFFLNFARTLRTQKFNLYKFECHLYQAQGRSDTHQVRMHICAHSFQFFSLK